MVGTKTD